MRHIVLALMIALLPVRGWMGDAMAVAMLAAPVQTMTQTAHTTAMPCPDHAKATPAAGAVHDGMAEAGDGSDSHHAHQSCDVCNGPAMAHRAGTAVTATPVHGVLAPPAEHFASSEPRRGIKPPIS
jgi:hypothetical protein